MAQKNTRAAHLAPPPEKAKHIRKPETRQNRPTLRTTVRKVFPQEDEFRQDYTVDFTADFTPEHVLQESALEAEVLAGQQSETVNAAVGPANGAAAPSQSKKQTFPKKENAKRASDRLHSAAAKVDRMAEEKSDRERRKMEKATGRRRKRNGRLGFVLLILLLLLVTGISVAGFLVSVGEAVFPNIYAEEIALGGLTQDEARYTLVKAGWRERAATPLTVTGINGETVDIDYIEAGLRMNTSDTALQAVNYGRDKDIYSNLLKYLLCLVRPVEINSAVLTPDNTYVGRQVRRLVYQEKASLANGVSVDLEQGLLVMIKGQGAEPDEEALHAAVEAALARRDTKLTCTALLGEAERPDFQALHDRYCTAAADAYFSTDGSHTIVPEVPGIDFDVTMAQQLWDETPDGEAVRIPLTVFTPTITAESLQRLLYRDLLGATTTKYNNSAENRCSNVRLAASKINDVVLYPGEEFSFNEVVGARTEAAGFLPAPAYAGYDDIQDEIGGGICQVSSALYASALFAFLNITEHRCHIYPPNYIQLGVDATVTIPEGGGRTIDFKFVNSKNYPIRIVTYCEETTYDNGSPFKTVTVELWGTLEPEDFMPVEFDNSYANVYDYDRFIEPAYPDRPGYTIKFTHEESEFEDDYGKGLRTLTHRKVIDANGTVIQDKIVNGTYSAGYALDTYYYKK